jgi:hypothetical protein
MMRKRNGAVGNQKGGQKEEPVSRGAGKGRIKWVMRREELMGFIVFNGRRLA